MTSTIDRVSGPRRLGTVLVGLQFVLIAALAILSGPSFASGNAPLTAWIAAIAGILLGLWAIGSNRPGNFNIRPTPRVGGRMIRSGPYGWVRHPMYTAVLACALACVIATPTAATWAGAAALLIVLLTKARLEERWMITSHPEYAAYRDRTKGFLPGLF